MGDEPVELKTGLLSDDELDRIRALRARSGPASGFHLVLYHRDGAQVIALDEGQPQVLGRERPADVVVRDASLSRQHACVELRDGSVYVEDLQSTNGTWIEGERIEHGTAEVGALLSFGAVTASLSGDGRALGLDGHDRFLRELDGELARARAGRGTVALILVRSARRAEQPVARWFAQVQAELRPFDRIALYSADTLEILLPDDDDVAARAERICRGEHPLRCGMGTFPGHAGSAGELLEVTSTALVSTREDQPVYMAETSTAEGVRAGAGGVIALDPATRRVFQMAGKLADTLIPVLIQGETGTGKEVVARAIHDGGPRSGAPMICVNCGSIPAQLVESTLFGHEKGAFTNADARGIGVFEAADGGTVLLDEVGELPAPAQAALLRVLETRRFNRVGSSEEVEVDVRVLAATHRDLEDMCDRGDFRRDLFYRLNAMTLSVPPLRDRLAEIEPLTRHFIDLAGTFDRAGSLDIDRDALEAMLHYDWPGNVRELRNAIDRAVVIASGATLTVDDLPTPVRRAASSLAPSAARHDGDAAEETGEVNLRAEVARFERNLLHDALRATDWDRNEAAARLGIPVRTLSHKMKAHKLVRGSG
jgi:DNA-binding NtrC family response regulator